ncbi:MAG TPA: class I SAM-dependent methyltransferase [Pyrinomonadaceae bacterium]
MRKLKPFLISTAPRCVAVYSRAKTFVGSVVRPSAFLENTFTSIYQENLWGDTESVSGPGSTIRETTRLRNELPTLLKEIGATSMLDAPCGDFNWLSKTELPLEMYIGADIVPDLIAQNQKLYANEQRDFVLRDITRAELPRVDVILCRDCFIHFSYRHIAATIRNFQRSKSRYLLTNTYLSWSQNSDISTGAFRPLNLQLPPFNFPPPRKLISEKDSQQEALYYNKSLGLWELADL